VVVLFSFGVNSAAAANASTIYVNTTGNNSWDGQSAIWNGTSGPKQTITNATGTVAENGTVYIAQGTYNESGININTNMIIIGESQQNTIINGQQSGNSIFTIEQGVIVTITNLTLENGTSNVGGAIVNHGNLTVTDSTFNNNTATELGGAIANDGNLTVTCSTLNNNTAQAGGAIFNIGGTLPVTSSTLNNNTAQAGGAICNLGGTLPVTSSTLNNNTAQGGGAILNEYGTLPVTCSTLNNNTAQAGGAIFNEDGNLTVTSSMLNNNIAQQFGGAIYNYDDGSFGDVNSVVNFNRIVGNSPNTSEIYCAQGTLDATLNWWGSNADPSVYVSNDTGGSVDVTSWLVLNITVDSASILNGGNATVTVDFLNDTNGSVNASLPDGIPVNFTGTNGSLNPTSTTLIDGQATSVFTANSRGLADINATVDNQTVTTQVIVNPVSYLYLNVTTSNSNQIVGETFPITYKLSNNGPDNATNVTVSFQIPEGLEFVSANVDNGTWAYNSANRTVTWTLDNVPVGDPYLYLTVRALGSGNYIITPSITSLTHNQNINVLAPITINAQPQNNENSGSTGNTTTNNNSTTVNAATKTIAMQNTGVPIAGFALAILSVLGGILIPRKK
ncbi:MAG: hypothetical protein K8E24_007210, partial [Methanobacterium paludis]|nr:hypothetical protein [Methanobacterium paludis]